MPSIAFADSKATRVATPNDVAAATAACVDAFIGRPDPITFVPEADWKITRKTERHAGEKRLAYHAVHRAMNLRIQYEPEQMCTIYAFLPVHVSTNAAGDELSFTVVVRGTRETISERHPILGARDETKSRVVLMGEGFEIDFTNVESGFDDNLVHLITVQAPKPISGN